MHLHMPIKSFDRRVQDDVQLRRAPHTKPFYNVSSPTLIAIVSDLCWKLRDEQGLPGAHLQRSDKVAISFTLGPLL